MVLTLLEVLVRALKTLEDSGFQRFIQKLSAWNVREEYRKIPHGELIGKDPEEVASLINEYYKYSYGSEVTLAVLEDINEKKNHEKLQHDLRELDIAGHGLGKPMFTDKVNFVDNHRYDLIGRITDVDPVLHDLQGQDLLTKEQYNDVMLKMTSEEKMRELCDIISHWEETEKYTAYTVLRKYNEEIVKIFEEFDKLKKNAPAEYSQGISVGEEEWGLPKFPTGLFPPEEQGAEEMKLKMRNERRKDTDMINIIDEFRFDLVRRIKAVDPVLSDLRDLNLLTEEQYNDVMEKTTSEEKMRDLCDIISHWDENVKYIVYTVLRKHNKEIITDLEMEEWESENDPTRNFSEINHETGDLPMEVTVDEISCTLCGKEQESAEVVELISTTDGTTDGTHRLELKSPGLYRCQKTGIKFLVKGPVIIEYKVDSWSDQLKHIPDKYEILGPLFNIRTYGDPSVVSAVHLPHFLCLKSFSEDTAMINCAHFKDGKMTLLTPAQIDPFYILLENPTFSLLGIISKAVKKFMSIHGMILIYFTILCKGHPAEEYRIHLYVLPYSKNAKEILDKNERRDGYERISKHSQINCPVQKNIEYRVSGFPEVTVHPQTVMFQSNPYHFTEIQLNKRDGDIYLYVSEERTRVEVWDSKLTQGDIQTMAQSLPDPTHGRRTSEHFVDRQRENLIDNISSVKGVLDALLQHKLLSMEAYDNVFSQSTSYDQMREIYRHVKSWDIDDKDIFYQTLKKHNPSTIKRLKRM